MLNNVDKDNSVVLPDITPVKERHGVDDSDVTLDKESQGKQSVANRFMAGMRHISGKSKRKDSSSTEESKEKENSCVRWGFVSPQRDNKVEPAQVFHSFNCQGGTGTVLTYCLELSVFKLKFQWIRNFSFE